jgi:hypothetical protein
MRIKSWKDFNSIKESIDQNLSGEKVGKVKFEIIQSDSKEIIDILDQSGIFSEFEPRFAVLVSGKIVGGSTYHLDETNTYNFDIAIIDEYQVYDISKPLIDKIIEDAKILIASGIKAQVTNNQLFDYLLQIGFQGSKDSNVKYCYLELINLEGNYPVKEQEDYFRNFGTKRYFVEIVGKNYFFTQSSGINDVKKRIVRDLEDNNLLIPKNRRELTQKIANYLRDNSKN